jgi:hypothetical protein
VTGFSYEDGDGAVVELTPQTDGSLTVTAQGRKGPIVCIAIPVGERASLAATATPPALADPDEWVPYGAALPRRPPGGARR